MRLGHYEAAGQELETLAGSLEASYAYLQIPILIQAAQAWLAAGKVERAYTVQSAALAREPNNIELLVDRAMTAASVGDYADAVADLGRALSHAPNRRSEEHTSELQSLMRISYAVFCLKKKTQQSNRHTTSMLN